jgi:hypothetical protein
MARRLRESQRTSTPALTPEVGRTSLWRARPVALGKGVETVSRARDHASAIGRAGGRARARNRAPGDRCHERALAEQPPNRLFFAGSAAKLDADATWSPGRQRVRCGIGRTACCRPPDAPGRCSDGELEPDHEHLEAADDDPILAAVQFALALSVAAIPVATPTVLSVRHGSRARLLASLLLVVVALVRVLRSPPWSSWRSSSRGSEWTSRSLWKQPSASDETAAARARSPVTASTVARYAKSHSLNNLSGESRQRVSCTPLRQTVARSILEREPLRRLR